MLAGLRTSGAFLAVALVCSGVATIASPSGASPTSSGGWGAPTMIDPGEIGGGLNSVSCASPTFCVAVDGDGNGVGSALTYNGHGWSSAKSIDPHGGGINSVSCPSQHFCAAVDANGNALLYDGHGWSAPARIDAGATGGENSVSCASASFCVALEYDGDALVYDGRHWSAPDAVGPGDSFNAVSCPATSACVAVEPDGDALTYSGKGWSAPVPSGTGGTSTLSVSLSCATTRYCMAIDNEGAATVDESGRWTPRTEMDHIDLGVYVSCGAPGFCMAVDGKGRAAAFEKGRWSNPVAVDANGGGLASVSCPSAEFCAAVDTNGNALVYKHRAPGLTPKPPASSGTFSVSGATSGSWKLLLANECVLYAVGDGAAVQLSGTAVSAIGFNTDSPGPDLVIEMLGGKVPKSTVDLATTRSFLVQFTSSSPSSWVAGFDGGHHGSGTLMEASGGLSGKLRAQLVANERDGGTVTVNATWNCDPGGKVGNTR
ncbi:MAG: hypothetical protein ACRDV8_01520 [Acidimicrobiales bacterium]